MEDIEDLGNVVELDRVGDDLATSIFKGKTFNMFEVTPADQTKAIRNSVKGISCSRRTDVPWAYLKPYMKALSRGFMYVPNPISGQPNPVYLSPYDFKTRKGVVFIAWWSKNYSKWIDEYIRDPDFFDQWPVHLFNFTLNSDCPDLEPNTAPLEERFEQVRWLVRQFGAVALNIRFDPIVFYQKQGSPEILSNLGDFERIVELIASVGINSLTFSFCLFDGTYSKVARNMRHHGLNPVKLDLAQQKTKLDILLEIAGRYGVTMRCCCSSGLIGYGSGANRVEASRCVNGDAVQQILDTKQINVKIAGQKDKGQRVECNCVGTRDIGFYQLCPHGCRYCYANPNLD